MSAPTQPIPAANLAAAGQALADAVAWRDSLSPEDAAVAAGARTPAEAARLADVIRRMRITAGAA